MENYFLIRSSSNKTKQKFNLHIHIKLINEPNLSISDVTAMKFLRTKIKRMYFKTGIISASYLLSSHPLSLGLCVSWPVYRHQKLNINLHRGEIKAKHHSSAEDGGK